MSFLKMILEFFKALCAKQEIKELTTSPTNNQEATPMIIRRCTNNLEEIQKIIRRCTNQEEVIAYFLEEILTSFCDLRDFFKLLSIELERIGWTLDPTEFNKISLKVDESYDSMMDDEHYNSMMNDHYDPFDAYNSMMDDIYHDEELKKMIFS